MKFRSMVSIAFGLALICAVLLANQPPSQAQSGDSSCITCHETEGKKPVRTEGQWHIQHNMLACEVCHAGNPSGETQEAAHTGQVPNPLEAGTTCAMCHPDNSQELITAYLAMITPESPATPTISPATTDEPCWVIATECAQSTGVASTPTAIISATETITPTTGAAAAGTEGGTTAGGSPATPTSGFTWMKALQFTRGPLFKAAFWFFVVGMLLRLVQALRSGWKHRVAVDKTGRVAGAGQSFLSGLLVLPFIPGLKGAFQRKPVIYLAGGLFHLGLLTVILLSKTHMSAWKSMIGFGWPVLPSAAVSWLAAIGIVAMLALLINRLFDPVLRLISGPSEWLNWLLVFLPMITGFVLARKLWLPYEVSFSIHMLLVDILLIWIPLSRISHFAFYFFSRAIQGVEFNTRRVVVPK